MEVVINLSQPEALQATRVSATSLSWRQFGPDRDNPRKKEPRRVKRLEPFLVA